MRSLALLVALLASIFAALGIAAASAARPNVLFIAVDDLRPELGCYGAKHIRSPNIDALARSGVVFNRAYCQQAVCSPSRTVVMTGTRPDTSRVWDLETHFRKALPDVVTLGQLFRQHGYFVQGMGKIYHGGYDDAPTWSVPWQTPRAPMYVKPENVALNERRTTPGAGKNSRRDTRGPPFEDADVPDDTYTDGKVADLAVATLRTLAGREEPFFLAVGFRYWDLYDPSKIELAPNRAHPAGAPEYAILPGGEMRAYHGVPDGPIPDELARRLKHGYYAAVSYTDAQVGKVVGELDRLGVRGNTIIVLWGDHGWKLGEHGAWCKHSNCENDTNAPLIVSAPGIGARGVRSDALVEFVDIYPTLADLAGLPLPAHLEGLSFRPVLQKPDRPWKRAAFSQYPRPGSTGGVGPLMGYSMRTADHRLTVWVKRRAPGEIVATELYDHREDPQENRNVADDPKRAADLARLMEQWRAGWRGALPAAGS
jgi:arylsulfatase A-like enzyme